MDNGDPRFPYPRFLRVPFVFVPHGNPPPLEWMEEHPNYVTIPAIFVPHIPPEPNMEFGSEPAVAALLDPLPEEPIYEEPEAEVEPEAPPPPRPLLYPHPRGPRPDDLRRVPPPGRKRGPGRPPDLSPGLAMARRVHIGIDLCRPEGARDLVRQTMRIMAGMDRFSGPVTYPTMHTPEALSAAVHAGMQHLAAHKGDVHAAMASAKAAGATGPTSLHQG
jgi:hypothetical protein